MTGTVLKYFKAAFPGPLASLLTEAYHQTRSFVGNWRSRADLKMFSSSHGPGMVFVHLLGLGAHTLSGAFWNGAGGRASGSFAGELALFI